MPSLTPSLTTLRIRSRLSWPAIREVKGLSCDKSKRSFLHNEDKIKLKSQNSITNAAVSNCHLATSKDQFEKPLDVGPSKGIGITTYFEGKNIFITGATGVLGKVLVEKILRSTPVGKIYVLVKGDDHKSAMQRLEKELVNSDLFGCLREKYGKNYQALMMEKLIPVLGNICESNLGMDSDSATPIMEEVNVIVASAAITTLNERYDLLLETNVNGAKRLMKFAKKCKSLELFVHISTAYVNGIEEGIILEEPLLMGENRREKNSKKSPNLFPQLDVADEINLALTSSTATTNYDMTRGMKRLGLERASLNGWYNAYHMTKAMAEMVIHDTRGDVPVLIIRPSAIESCYKEPSPGWIQGNRVLDPLIISYGKGQLPAFLGHPDSPADIIPLDIVVNTTIAAIAKHGLMRKSDLIVYQVASSLVNPLRYSDFFEYIYEYFSSEPLIEWESFTKINYYPDFTSIKYFKNFIDFSKYTREEIFRRVVTKSPVSNNTKRSGKLDKQCRTQIIYAENLCKMYEFLGFFKARFHSGNTQKLLSEMSKEEEISFSIDVAKIDWRKYLQEIHIPGLRKHVLNDKRISI